MPRKKAEEPMVDLHIRVPQTVKTALQAQHGTRQSEFVRRLIETALDLSSQPQDLQAGYVALTERLNDVEARLRKLEEASR